MPRIQEAVGKDNPQFGVLGLGLVIGFLERISKGSFKGLGFRVLGVGGLGV